MKSGLTPLWTNEMVEDFFKRFADKAENRILTILQRSGEIFVKEARLRGTYYDQTGNLRSSIGYIIMKDGDILSENFQLSDKGTDRYSGLKQGNKIAKEVSNLFPNGYILIGVAGMEYAICVEAKGYDVVTGACMQCEKDLKKASESIFNGIYGRV